MPHPGYITFHGDPYALSGSPLPVGSPAPDFMLVQVEAGVQRVIDRPTRLDAGKPGFSGRVTALLVSSDLPFTLNRFREAENLLCLEGSSDYYGSFGAAYGVLIDGPRILARAVFVLDRDGTVQHEQVVDEITTEPDYGAAIAALAQLV